MSFLLPLVLAAAAQVLPPPAGAPPDVLAYFPPDALALARVDPEPWRRLGEDTRLHGLLAHPGLRQLFDALESPPLSWDLLASFRVAAGIGLDDLRDGRVLIVIEPLPGGPGLDPAAFGEFTLEAGEEILVHGTSDGRAWCQDGDRTLLLLRFPGANGRPGFPAAAAWLAQRVREAHAGANATGMASLRELRATLESDEDLLRLYLPFDEWSLENLFGLLGEPEEAPFDLSDLLAPFGLAGMRGFGLVTAIDGPFLRDRMLLSGDQPLAPIYGAGFAEPEELIARLEALPGDATTAAVTSADLASLLGAFGGLLDTVLGALDMDWRSTAYFEWYLQAQELAATLGQVVTACQRPEDLWEGRSGALWVDLADAAAFETAFANLPAALRALLESGFDGGPGSHRFSIRAGDGRLQLASSLAEEPAATRFGENAGWLRARPWVRQTLAGHLALVLRWMGPEVPAEGIDLLRRDGLPDPIAALLPRAINFAALPDFDTVAAALDGTVAVAYRVPAGLMLECRGSIGYLGMFLTTPALVDAIGQSWSSADPFPFHELPAPEIH